MRRLCSPRSPPPHLLHRARRRFPYSHVAIRPNLLPLSSLLPPPLPLLPSLLGFPSSIRAATFLMCAMIALTSPPPTCALLERRLGSCCSMPLDQPWRRPPFSFCMPSSPSTQSSSIPFPTITREKMWMAAAVPAGRPPPPPPLSSPGWPPRYAIRGPSLFSRRLGRPLLYAAGSTSAAANLLRGGAVGWRLHHRHAASGIRVY